MICIAVVNSKGGTGKTTLTAALAVRAAKEGHRVAAVDLDPQHSLARWFHLREAGGATLEVLSDEDDAREARRKLETDSRGPWDFVFFDGPPGALATVESMVPAADFVVVPIRTSSLDLMATRDVAKKVREAGRQFIVVLNDRITADKLHADIREFLVENDLPVAVAEVAHRRAYITAMTTGQTAPEVNRDAASEVEALWQEIKAAAVAAVKAARSAKAPKKKGGRQ